MKHGSLNRYVYHIYMDNLLGRMYWVSRGHTASVFYSIQKINLFLVMRAFKKPFSKHLTEYDIA